MIAIYRGIKDTHLTYKINTSQLRQQLIDIGHCATYTTPNYFLYNYMDDLSSTLMYADDLVVFCPSSAGLEDLLKACDLYDKHHDILFNHNKCALMIFCSRGYKKCSL